MTSRDRAIMALERKTPDRVPVFELLIDPRIVEALVPGGDYLDFCQQFPIDMVLTPTPSALYKKELLEEREGIQYIRTEWGETRAVTEDIVPMPSGGFPIKTFEDFERYTPPDPRAPERMQPLRDRLARFGGEKAVGMHLHEAFSYPTYLMGMEALLLATLTEPDLVHALVEMSAEHQSIMARAACDLGADFILLGDDYCDLNGPLMSPACFEEFFLPGLAKVVGTIKDCGAYAIKHTDGNVLPIMDLFIEAGIDAIHPCDPTAGMSPADMKCRYGDRLCVMGNVDTGAPLCDWSVEKVREYVGELIRESAPGGGWIISSANTIHRGVRPENYRAMLETVLEEGVYPVG